MGQTNWTQTFEVLVEIKYNVSETQPGPGMKYTNARDEAPRLRPGPSAVPETPPCPSSLAWDSSGLAPCALEQVSGTRLQVRPHLASRMPRYSITLRMGFLFAFVDS